MPRLFGTDGVRGLANRELTADLALGLAQAAAAVLTQGRHADELRAAGRRPVAVVARDPRVSGEFLTAAVAAGLASSGVDVLDAGRHPDPGDRVPDRLHPRRLRRDDLGVAQPRARQRHQVLLVRRHEAPRRGRGPHRVATSASRSSRPSAAASAASSDSPTPRTATSCTCSARCRTASTASTSCSTAPTARPRASRPRRSATPGAKVTVIGADPDGMNINDGVGSTHLEPLQAAVREHGADLGIAHDGDADRCLAVDADGNVDRRRPDHGDPRRLDARARHAHRRHARRHRDVEPRPSPRDGRTRHPRDRDQRRRPLRARGARGRAASRSAGSSRGTSS